MVVVGLIVRTWSLLGILALILGLIVRMWSLILGLLLFSSTCTVGFFNLFLVFLDLIEIRFGCWILKKKKIWLLDLDWGFVIYWFGGENSQIPRFDKICGKLALVFSTQVFQDRVLNSTQVQWTRVPRWPRIWVIKKVIWYSILGKSSTSL